jgi:hypothetical protein
VLEKREYMDWRNEMSEKERNISRRTAKCISLCLELIALSDEKSKSGECSSNWG